MNSRSKYDDFEVRNLYWTTFLEPMRQELIKAAERCRDADAALKDCPNHVWFTNVVNSIRGKPHDPAFDEMTSALQELEDLKDFMIREYNLDIQLIRSVTQAVFNPHPLELARLDSALEEARAEQTGYHAWLLRAKKTPEAKEARFRAREMRKTARAAKIRYEQMCLNTSQIGSGTETAPLPRANV